jgi:hypothetical protein
MRYGCKLGFPHDYIQWYQDEQELIEVCQVCGNKAKWKKVNGRVDNPKYLEAHIREYCQPRGKHAQLYHILYRPELYEANHHEWRLNCSHAPILKQRDLTRKGTNAQS